MAWGEPKWKTMERMKRLTQQYPELDFSTPDKVMEEDRFKLENHTGAVSQFSQDTMNLAAYSAQQGADLLQHESQSYGNPDSRLPDFGNAGSLYDENKFKPRTWQDAASPLDLIAPGSIGGEMMTHLDRPRGALAGGLTDISNPLGGAMGGFQDPSQAQFRNVGPIAALPDNDIIGGLSARDIVGGVADLGLDPTNYVGAGAVGSAGDVARLAGRGAIGYRNITKGLPVGASIKEVGEGVAENPQVFDDPVTKLTSLIKAAKPARRSTEVLKSQELARRSGRVAGSLQSGSGESAFFSAKGQLRGELPKAQFEAPRVGLTSTDITDLFDRIRVHETLRPFDKINTADALTTALSGQIPTRGQLKQLEGVFGPDMVEALLSKRSFGQKAWETLLDTLNVPRSLMTSIDLSAPFRQGIMLAPGNPREFVGGMGPMMRAFGSQRYAQAVDESIRRSPYADIKEAARLYIAPLGQKSASLSDQEEAIMSRLVQKIPGVHGSQRAYVTYLNKLRSDIFDKFWEGLDEGQQTQDNADRFASFLNAASGRGNISALGNVGPALNGILFSPRYLVSRPETAARGVGAIADLAKTTAMLRGPNPVSKQIAKDMIAFFGTGLAALTLVKESGLADVEVDPRSADFGKVRVGPTRYDFWAGNVQIARFMSQMVTGERKSTTSGDVNEADRGSIIESFIRSKLAPVPGTAVNFMKGENLIGDEVDLTPGSAGEQLYKNLVPLVLQEFREGWEQEGALGVIKAAPAIVGVGTQTYGATETDKAAKAEYNGRTYRELEPFEREEFKAKHPELFEEMVAGGSDEFKRSEKVKADYLAEQSASDTRLERNELQPRQWREDYRTRQSELAARRDEIYSDVEFDNEDNPLNLYFDQIEAAKRDDGTIDWELVDGYRAGLSDADNAYIDRNTGLSGTTKVKEYRADVKVIDASGYWDLPDQLMAEYAAEQGFQGETLAEVRQWMHQTLMGELAAEGIRGVEADSLANAYTEQLLGDYSEMLSELRRIWRLEEHPEIAPLLAKWGYHTPGVAESEALAGIR
jgi:hypothetical protein